MNQANQQTENDILHHFRHNTSLPLGLGSVFLFLRSLNRHHGSYARSWVNVYFTLKTPFRDHTAYPKIQLTLYTID